MIEIVFGLSSRFEKHSLFQHITVSAMGGSFSGRVTVPHVLSHLPVFSLELSIHGSSYLAGNIYYFRYW